MKEVTDCMDKYDFGIALQKIIELTRDEFCDWYIEICKARLYDMTNTTRNSALTVLRKVLIDCLKMLHPFMPFITEEIYTKLPNSTESIMISDYPKYDEKFIYENEENDLELVKEIITGIRNLRANMNVAPSKKATMIFVTNRNDIIEEGRGYLEKLAGADKVLCQSDKTGIAENAVSLAVSGIEIYIPFDELVDIDKEIERLEKEKLTYTNEINRAKRMLDNPGFTSKAPQDKIDAEKAKIEKYEELLKKTEERIDSIKR